MDEILGGPGILKDDQRGGGGKDELIAKLREELAVDR